MGKASILYGDMAVNAHNLFVASSDFAQPQSDMRNLVLAEPRAGIREATLIENSTLVLDDGWYFIPEDYSMPPNASWGFISNVLCDENGIFTAPVTVRFTSPSPVTSPGITIMFDAIGDAWADSITVQWLRGGAQVAQSQFHPDAVEYYAEQEVAGYDEVVISIEAWVFPRRYAKINNVQFGKGVIIDRLLGVSLYQEISPVSAALAVSTLSFTASAMPGQSFRFQRGQRVDCYFDELLVGTYFIDTIDRTSEYSYAIKANCYVAMLDASEHPGGIYLRTSARAIAEEICAVAKVPLSFEAKDVQLEGGWLPFATCRENLAQVCFAAGYICGTSFSDKLRIYDQPSGIDQYLTPDEIYVQAAKITENEIPKTVSLASHLYNKGNAFTNRAELFSASRTKTTGRVRVIFDSAHGDLEISNGTIEESGDNFAIITAYDDCILTGVPYTDTMIFTDITADEDSVKKALTISEPSMVSGSLALRVLSNLYAYYRNPYFATFKVTNPAVRCGSRVAVLGAYLSPLIGIVERMEFRLDGTKMCPTITVSSNVASTTEGNPWAGDFFAGEVGLW